MRNNTAVIWVRVSSEDQSHGYSLSAQEDLLKKYAEKLELDVVETYRVTESAKTSENRKQFKAMIASVDANSVGHIVAYSVDRLSRNRKDLGTIQDRIDDSDVSVHIASEGKVINKKTSGTDRFLFQLMGSFAEMENKRRAEATRFGMEKKVRSGGVARMPPIGYTPVADPADGRRRIVIVDPERGPLVQQAFELYAEGKHSIYTLVDELNRRGLTTRPSPKRPAHPVQVSHINKILKNSFYHGEHKWSGETFTGTYETLIDKALFNRVQVVLSDHRSYVRPAAKKFFAFKPFLRCGYCGCQITGEEHNDGANIYYRCSYGRKIKDPDYYQKRFGTAYCPQKRWTEADVDRLMGDALGRLYIDDFIAGKVRERLKLAHAEENSFEVSESRRLGLRRTKLRTYLDTVYADRLDGTITKEEYLEKRAAFQRDLDAVNADLARLTRRNVKYKDQGSEIIDLLRGFKDVYMAADLAGKSKILHVMLKKAVLKGEETYFDWHEPFGTLFSMGEVLNKSKWGE